MSRLSKLYQAMETLASEGLELSPEQKVYLHKARPQLNKEVQPQKLNTRQVLCILKT